MRDILYGALFMVLFFCVGYSLGKDVGYDRALKDVAAATPIVKTTDQQCVAWLFDANMKDVKKRICK